MKKALLVIQMVCLILTGVGTGHAIATETYEFAVGFFGIGIVCILGILDTLENQ